MPCRKTQEDLLTPSHSELCFCYLTSDLSDFRSAAQQPTVSGSSSITAMTQTSGTAAVTTVTGSVPLPYDPARIQEHGGSVEEDYLWLSHCQSHIR